MIIKINHRRLGEKELLIDDEDYDKVKDFSWRLNTGSNKHTYYAQHTIYEKRKFVKRISIHRLIMGLGDYSEDKRQINHIDGNGLNNKKEKLEIGDHMYR